MINIIINPGTGPQPAATEANADETIKRFVEDLGIPHVVYGRCPGLDSDSDLSVGYFGYILRWRWDTFCQVDIPGIDPDVVQEGRPWFSPRLYVNGNSWLWGFALSAASRALTGADDE